MEELAPLIRSPSMKSSDLAKILREFYDHLMREDRSVILNVVDQLFAVVQQQPEGFEDEQWVSIKILVYYFILSLHPPGDRIPALSLETEYGSLFEATLVMYFMRDKKDNAGNTVFLKALNDATEKVLKPDDPAALALTPTRYMAILPKLIADSMPLDEYEDQLIDILRAISKESVVKSNYVLFDNIFRLLVLQSKNGKIFMHMDELITKWFGFGMISPVATIASFWNFGYNQMQRRKDPKYVEFINRLFERALNTCPAEMMKNICHFGMLTVCEYGKIMEDHIIQTLLVACQGVRYLGSSRNDPKKRDVEKKFILTMLEKQKTRSEWMLHMVMAHFVSVLGSYAVHFKKLKKVHIKNDLEQRPSIMVSFSEQGNMTRRWFDDHLFTKMEICECENREKAIKKFNKFIKLSDQYIKMSYTMNWIGNVVATILDPKRVDNSPMTMMYCEMLIEAIFSFFITATQRLAMLQSFVSVEMGKHKANAPVTMLHVDDLYAGRGRIDFGHALNDSMKNIPEQWYPLLINAIIPLLKSKLKKHKISLNFVTLFCEVVPQTASFWKLLFSTMLKEWNEMLQNVGSSDYDDTLILQQWTYLMIKLGTTDGTDDPSMTEQKMKLLVGNMKIIAQLVTTVSLHRAKFVTCQKVLAEAAFWVQNIVVSYGQQDQHSSSQAKQRRYNMFDGIVSNARGVMAEVCFYGPIGEYPALAQIIGPVIAEGLKSRNPNIREKALDKAIEVLSSEKNVRFLDSSFHEPQKGLLESLFGYLRNADRGIEKVIGAVGKYPSLFLDSANQSMVSEPDGLCMTKYGVPINKMLMEIEQKMEDGKLDSPIIFTLLSSIFETEGQVLNESENVMPRFLYMLTVICKHTEISQSIHALLRRMTEAYLTTNSDKFWINLLCGAAMSSNVSQLPLINEAVVFVEKAQLEVFRDSMDKICSCILAHSFNVFLLAASMLAKKEPTLLKPRHLQIMCQWNSSHCKVMEAQSLLKNIMKLVIPTFTDAEKEEFVNFCATQSNVSVLAIYPILKILFALKIPVAYRERSEHMLHTVSMYMVCGVNGPFAITPQLVAELLAKMKEPAKDRQAALVHFGIFMIEWAVLKSNCQAFLENQEFVNFAYKHLSEFCTNPRVSNAIMKVFVQKNMKMMLMRFPNIIKQLPRDDPKQLLQQTSIMSLVPQKLTREHAKVLFDVIFRFGTIEKEQRLNIIMHTRTCIKCLALMKKGNVDELKIIGRHVDSTSYLKKFVYVMADATRDLVTPFESVFVEHVNDLLEIFIPDGVIDVVFSLAIEDNVRGIENLLKHMMTRPAFREQFVTKNERTYLHPVISRVLKHMAKLYNDPVLLDLIKRVFSDVLKKYEMITNQYGVAERMGMPVRSPINEVDLTSVNNITEAYVIMASRVTTDTEWVFRVAEILVMPMFSKSKTLHRFERTAFSGKPREWYEQLFNEVIHNMNDIPASVCSLLLKRVIKHVMPLENDQKERVWDVLMSHIHNDDKLSVVISGTIRLLKECGENPRYTAVLLESLPSMLKNSNSKIVLKALKLSRALQKMKLMERYQHILDGIGCFILSFKMMLEMPFEKVSAKILANMDVEKMSPRLIDMIRMYFMDKLWIKRERQLQKVGSLLQHVPLIMEILPSSIIDDIIYITGIIPRENVNDALQLIKFPLQLSNVVKSTPQEKEKIASNALTLCRNILFSGDHAPNPVVDLMLSWIAQNGCSNFPPELFTNWMQYHESHYPSIAACALEYLPPEVTLRDSKTFWDKTIELITRIPKIDSRVIPQIMKKLCELPAYQHLVTELKTALYEVSEQIPLHVQYDRKLVILSSLIEFDNVTKFDTMTDGWKLVPKKGMKVPRNVGSLVRLLIVSLELLDMEQQETYWGIVEANAEVWGSQLASGAAYLLRSDRVFVKEKIINYMIMRMRYISPTYTENFLSAVQECGAPIGMYVQAALAFVCSSKYLSRVQSAANLQRILGETERERLLALSQIMTQGIWNDSTLAIISLLISDQDKSWPPLVAMSHVLKPVAGKMFAAVLTRVMNPEDHEIMDAVHSLFEHSLQIKYVQILSGFLNAYAAIGVTPNVMMSLAAIKVTGEMELFNADTTEAIPNRFILNADQNGPLMTSVLVNGSLEQATMAAYTFLQHYEEAGLMQAEVNSVCMDGLSKFVDFQLDKIHESGIFAELERPKTSGPVHHLKEALESIADPQKRATVAKDLREWIHKYDALSLRAHPFWHPTYTERLVATELCAKMIVDRSSVPDTVVLNKALPLRYTRMLERVSSMISPEGSGEPTVSELGSSDATIVFAPITKNKFRYVLGYTPNGFPVVAMSQVDRLQPTNNRSEYDLRTWSIITYTLFMASPTAIMSRAALIGLINLARMGMTTLPVFMRMETSARILTVFRIGISKGMETMQVLNELVRGFDDEVRKQIKSWPFQLAALGMNRWFRDVVDSVMHDHLMNAVELATGQVADQNNIRVKSMVAFETFCQQLFDMNFDKYQEGRKLEKFIRRYKNGEANLRPMEGIDVVCLDDLRSDNDIYNFIDMVGGGVSSYAELKNAFYSYLDEVNKSLVFMVISTPMKSQELDDESRVMKVFPSIHKLSPTAFRVKVLTQRGAEWCLIEKVPSSVIASTFSNMFIMTNDALKWSYQTRRRGLTLQSVIAFPIGHQYILRRAPKVIAGDPGIGDRLIANRPLSEVYKLAKSLARSFGLQAVVRDMFSLYQNNHTLVSSKLDCFMTSIADFCAKKSLAAGTQPAIYMPEWMISAFGDTMKGEIVLAEAAVGECLVHNVETVRAAVEVLAGEHVRQTETFHSEVVGMTSDIEKKVVKFAPPILPGAELQDALDWMTHLIWVADSARESVNVDMTPPEEPPLPQVVDYSQPSIDTFDFMEWDL